MSKKKQKKIINRLSDKIKNHPVLTISNIIVGILGIIVGVILLAVTCGGNTKQKNSVDPAELHFLEGSRLMADYEWSDAISEFKKALKEAKGNNSIKFCNLIGLCYYATDELDSASERYKLSASLANDFKEKKGEAVALRYLGLIFKARGEKEKALKYFEDALKISTQIGAEKEIEIAQRNIKELMNK